MRYFRARFSPFNRQALLSFDFPSFNRQALLSLAPPPLHSYLSSRPRATPATAPLSPPPFPRLYLSSRPRATPATAPLSPAVCPTSDPALATTSYLLRNNLDLLSPRLWRDPRDRKAPAGLASCASELPPSPCRSPPSPTIPQAHTHMPACLPCGSPPCRKRPDACPLQRSGPQANLPPTSPCVLGWHPVPGACGGRGRPAGAAELRRWSGLQQPRVQLGPADLAQLRRAHPQLSLGRHPDPERRGLAAQPARRKVAQRAGSKLGALARTRGTRFGARNGL